MFLVEFIGQLSTIELAHLQVGDCETALINSIDNFAGLSVTVRFDQSEGSTSSLLESLTSMNIGVIH